MFVNKDLNIDGVNEWLDPQVLDILLTYAPMKNNAKDGMKANLFRLPIEQS
jgi:hypothetical protein